MDSFHDNRVAETGRRIWDKKKSSVPFRIRKHRTGIESIHN
jgi:hypothetical protein